MERSDGIETNVVPISNSMQRSAFIRRIKRKRGQDTRHFISRRHILIPSGITLSDFSF